jgi:LPS-assembly lipoprotein
VLAGLAGFSGLGLLAGCEFTPVYATGTRASDLNRRIAVAAPQGDAPFVLSRMLENRLGPADVPDYILSFDLDIDIERIAITATQDTNRFNIVAIADWELTETANGAVLQDGVVDSFTSYAATGTPVAVRSAETDALNRLMQILADKILAELLTGAQA